MVRHANKDNKYIDALKTDIDKSNKMSVLLVKKVEHWLDIVKDNWTFEVERPTEEGDYGNVSGPTPEDKFSEFIDSIIDDETFQEFFGEDIPDNKLKELSEFIYDEEVGRQAYDKIEETIDEEKEGFLEDYGNPDRNNNYPYGPGMSQRDFL